MIVVALLMIHLFQESPRAVHLKVTLHPWDRDVHARVREDMEDGKPSKNLKPPRQEAGKEPEYPKAAYREGRSGAAMVLARVGIDGRIAAIVKSGGDDEFVEALQAAVTKWRIRPVQLDGTPHEMMLCVQATFTAPPRRSQPASPAPAPQSCIAAAMGLSRE